MTKETLLDKRSSPAETTRDESIPTATIRDGSAATSLDNDSRAAVRNGIRVVVPEALRERYHIKQQLPTQGAEADILLAEELENGRQVVIKLYRQGVTPKTDVLERICKAEPAHVIILYEHGQLEGVWYEVLEYAVHGSLRDMLKGQPIPSEQVRVIVTELCEALRHLHSQNILHRDLKPENILIRTQFPLDLVLIDFGIASVAESSHHFTSGNRTVKYAAPEAMSGVICKGSDYWSLGMILLECLSGRHVFDGLSEAVINQRLATQPVDLSNIADNRWQLLFRGLLVRDPSKRWGENEVTLWLNGDMNLNVAVEDIVSKGASLGNVRPFHLGKRECSSLRELAVALAADWEEGVKRLARGFILSWFRDDLRDDNLASFVMDLADNSSLTPDTRLLQLIYRLAPDLPPVWNGFDVSTVGLLALAGQAQNDEAALNVLNGVLDILTDYPHPEMKQLSKRWAQVQSEYESAWVAVTAAGGEVSSLRPDNRVATPLLVRLMLDQDAANEQRDQLAKDSDELQACRWYSVLDVSSE